MFITPAFAQGANQGGSDLIVSLVPFILIFAIMYFLVLRPQQKRMKEHREMVAATRRGDTIVTNGGIIGKVTKVFEENDEIQVEIADGVRVRILRATVSEVRAKGEPVKEASSS